LGGKNVKGEKFFFVRSSPEVKNNNASGYHVINNAYSFSELNTSMFTDAERGDEKYKPNMQTIVDFLEKLNIVTRIKKKSN
jgi:hypothetical protein